MGSSASRFPGKVSCSTIYPAGPSSALKPLNLICLKGRFSTIYFFLSVYNIDTLIKARLLQGINDSLLRLDKIDLKTRLLLLGKNQNPQSGRSHEGELLHREHQAFGTALQDVLDGITNRS